MNPESPKFLPDALAAEVEELRRRHADTQDLYREVCTLLFFRHGITPTANKLYQLVRKGSMSAPAEALARFWQALREKSRVRIAHPDLPQELADTAGELIGGLWQRAQASAQAAFADAMQASRDAVAQADAQAAAELARAEAAAHALFQLQAEFSASLTRMQDLEHTLAREQGVGASLEKQLASAVAQRRELQEALAAARRDFEGQLEQERAAHRTTREQAQADVRQAQLDAERERALAQALRTEMEQVRREAGASAERHGAEAQALRQEVSRLRQDLGLAEGALAEARAARDFVRRQLDKALLQAREAAPGRRGRILRRIPGG
jgi:chromosome segregation ATPase